MTPSQEPSASAADPHVASPSFYGEAAMDYEDYLRIGRLVELQRPLSDPPHHDEMLFIVIHQAYELWFKLVLHEMDRSIRLLEADEPLEAHHFLVRCVQIMKLLTHQIHILETMRPADFLGFRDHLKPASGFQSLQFRQIEFVLGLKDPSYLRWFTSRPDQHARLKERLEATDLRTAFYGTLRRAGLDIPEDVSLDHLSEREADRLRLLASLRRLYEKPQDAHVLYLLAETLVDLDVAFAMWRHHHVQVVERIIGDKRGTGGSSGAAYLRTTTHKRCFPYLWQVRTGLGETGG